MREIGETEFNKFLSCINVSRLPFAYFNCDVNGQSQYFFFRIFFFKKTFEYFFFNFNSLFQIHNHQMILKEQWNDTNHYFLTALIGHFQKLCKGPAIGTEYENSKIFYCGKLMYLKSIFGNVINLSHSSYPHLIYKIHIIH